MTTITSPYTRPQLLLRLGKVVEIQTTYQFATWEPHQVIVEVNDDPFSNDGIVMLLGFIKFSSDLLMAEFGGYIYDLATQTADYSRYTTARVPATAFRVLSPNA